MGGQAWAEEVTLFARGDFSGWEYREFEDVVPTLYRRVTAADGGGEGGGGGGGMEAVSRGGASGWTMRRDVFFEETPWLRFRWRVDEVAETGGDETSRDGDDFAWRLYFVGRSGFGYRALNVVFSAREEVVGSGWVSPYAGIGRNIYVHAAAGGAARGEWRTSVVNVGAVWREVFGEEGVVGLVGVMTDADNAGGVMRAVYGEAVLSEDAPGAVGGI